MKTIRELFTVHKSGGWLDTGSLIAALEDREAERDAKERERVKAALQTYCVLDYVAKDIINVIYPPPKPEKLPAGWLWYKRKDEPADEWTCEWFEEQAAWGDYEFRPWNDPPPEVTGKVEPVLPTFEEWCVGQGESLCNWDQPVWTWWSDGGSMGRSLPKDVFDAIEAYEESHSAWRSKNLNDNKQARNALKAVLLKLGRIR